MSTAKFSISLPVRVADFIDTYLTVHACKSRSEVIQEALKLLQQQELEYYYREASKEVDPAFEITTFDGLEDEAW